MVDSRLGHAYQLRGLQQPSRQGQPQTAGKISVSNGTETMQIDAADLAEAEAEGFKAVK
jgi:hypothetical protein